MSGPPGMTNSYMSGSIVAIDMRFKVSDLSAAFINVRFVTKDSNSGGIIPTVFKSFQTINQKGIYITAANVTNNSTHNAKIEFITVS
jgi:hypothetical protein